MASRWVLPSFGVTVEVGEPVDQGDRDRDQCDDDVAELLVAERESDADDRQYWWQGARAAS